MSRLLCYFKVGQLKSSIRFDAKDNSSVLLVAYRDGLMMDVDDAIIILGLIVGRRLHFLGPSGYWHGRESVSITVPLSQHVGVAAAGPGQVGSVLCLWAGRATTWEWATVANRRAVDALKEPFYSFEASYTISLIRGVPVESLAE